MQERNKSRAMKGNRILAMAAMLGMLALAACTPAYTLVPAKSVGVAKNSIRVEPLSAWNRITNRGDDLKWEENWTRNGPALDVVSFIGGLPDGTAIVKQAKKADQKVPVFRASMTPPDLVSMIESFYRIRAGATVFETTAVEPATFLGSQGLRFDYTYVGADEVKRRGRCIAAIINDRLYLMLLNAAASHYFEATLPEFEAMAASARLG